MASRSDLCRMYQLALPTDKPPALSHFWPLCTQTTALQCQHHRFYATNTEIVCKTCFEVTDLY